MSAHVRRRQHPVVLAGLLVLALAGPGRAVAVEFLRGDANGDRQVSIADAVVILRAIFGEAVEFPCEAAADTDADGRIGLADSISMLTHVFLGSQTIRAPHPECGDVPESAIAGRLTCQSSGCGPRIPPAASDAFFFFSDRHDAGEPAVDAVVVEGDPGQVIHLTLTMFLVSDDARAWSTGVVIQDASAVVLIDEVTTSGTVAGQANGRDEGLVERGFTTASTIDEHDAFTGVLLDLVAPKTLASDVGRSAHPVLRLVLTILLPQEPAEQAFTVDTVEQVRGLGGSVFREIVTQRGSFAAESTPLEVRVITREPDGYFLRGDADGDLQVVLSDAVFTLNWLFANGAEPNCLDSADSDDDGRVTVSDAVRTLCALFQDCGALPDPFFGECGRDPTRDELSCLATTAGC